MLLFTGRPVNPINYTPNKIKPLTPPPVAPVSRLHQLAPLAFISRAISALVAISGLITSEAGLAAATSAVQNYSYSSPGSGYDITPPPRPSGFTGHRHLVHTQ